ncbi:MAG: thioredoxin-dependent thiol peroxidase [Chloroflexaceae bacterium]|nr:thioredoxin-dependent thiol peroxidase [Chloroflexaceae bacterium]NJO04101.1 thioredoxin-dependent thiol peroxidase [Chloroflexaceae bacterium]
MPVQVTISGTICRVRRTFSDTVKECETVSEPTTLQAGASAPDFMLPSDTGEMVRLSDFRGRRVILYFYPKDDTSGCTTQACGFRDAYPQIEEKNAVVLGISPDGQASHQKFKTRYDLPFILLSDEAHKVAEMYGVWGEKKMYGKTYMGIVRSHFVIDEAGNLLDVQVKVSPKDSVTRALEMV